MRARTAVCLIAALAGLSAAPAQGQTLEGGFDLAEYHFEGDDALFVDGALSYGGETSRIVAKVAAGGSVGQRVDEIEGQLLYSHAIGENVALLVGVKHEFRPHPHWTYAAIGIEAEPLPGLAAETYFFVSEKGDFLGEAKVIYDQPVLKRVTLQPRAAFSYALDEVPAQGLASGLTDAEFGLRLRYELSEPFAPYVGVSHERLLGKTADVARLAGDEVKATHFVVGFSSTF
jgi:copper resistance protein B